MTTVEIVEDILAHFGSKGMKWGVRKSSSSDLSGPSRKQRRADKKFEKSVNIKTWTKINNIAANATNVKHVDRINNKPEYKAAAARGDFHDGTKSITKKYYKEHQDAFLKEVKKSADSLGTNASGTRKYQIVTDVNNNWFVTTTEVKHEDTSFTVKIIYDKEGLIDKLDLMNDIMIQSVDFIVEDILAHYGRKGMKWGVRRNRAGDAVLSRGFGITTTGSRERSAAAVKSRTNVTIKDKGKKLKTSGGKGLPAHPDALRAHRVGQVVKKSGTKSVSNQDLQAYANRLQVEQNVSRLNSNNQNVGAKVSKVILKQAGNKAVQEVTGAAMSQVKTMLIKRMKG